VPTDNDRDESRIRSHGWVTKLPGGAVARCGGQGMCSHCQLERAVLNLKAALAISAQVAANASDEMIAAQGRAERAEAEADKVLSALVELLASVNVATLEDPSKYRVANTCALAALVARDVVCRHGLEHDLAEAVRVRMEAAGDGR
jgi:hypothetical protein